MESDEPVIQYRTFCELSADKNKSLEKRLREELIQCSLVQKWLNQLEFTEDQIAEYLSVDDHRKFIGRFFSLFHGSTPKQADNYLYKLHQLGLDSSFKEFDDLIKKIVLGVEGGDKSLISSLATIFSGIGYYAIVKDYYDRRLQLLAETVKNTDFNIYRNRDRVKFEYIVDNQFLLPQTYDLFAFVELKSENEGLRVEIDKIIEAIVDERYQKLNKNFGYGFFFNRSWNSIGYKIDLPGFFDFSTFKLEKDFLRKVYLVPSQ